MNGSSSRSKFKDTFSPKARPNNIKGNFILILAVKVDNRVVNVSKVNDLYRSTGKDDNEFEKDIQMKINEMRSLRQSQNKKKINKFLPENKTRSFVDHIIDSKMTL
jgi:ribosomal protein L18E